MKRFSIIIPNYNKGLYVKDCLDSIFNQTIDKNKLEIIFVDDGSTDNSLEIASSYDVNIIHSNRTRAGGARNKGLDIATGEYIIFIDSDDYLTSNNSLKILDDKIKDEDCVVFNYTKIALDDTLSEIIQLNETIDKRIADNMNLGVVTYCVKREVIGQTRFLEGCAYEDVLYTLNIWCKCQTITYLEGSFYTYRKTENSITTSAVDARKQIDLLIQFNNLYYLCLDFPQYKEALLYRINNRRINKRYIALNHLLETGENLFHELVIEDKSLDESIEKK